MKVAIGEPFVTSVMIRDQSGADEPSDSVSVSGELSLLPIQTPTTIAGAFGSFGGATKP